MVPTRICLVGHFTRADVPAFSDFQTLTELIACVRSTFLSIDENLKVDIKFDDGDPVELQVILRDTMLLTPATSKSLKALGELVGVEKITLDPDPAKEQFYKENMDVLLRENPDLFERYAINDAVICVKYLEQLIEQCVEVLNVRKVPATLTSIGVDLLMQRWASEFKAKPEQMIGKEVVKDRFFSKAKGYFVTKRVIVDLKEVEWHSSLATECYHGGRNEQFWFGPSFEDDWTDYDLSGAYPTAWR